MTKKELEALVKNLKIQLDKSIQLENEAQKLIKEMGFNHVKTEKELVREKKHVTQYYWELEESKTIIKYLNKEYQKAIRDSKPDFKDSDFEDLPF